MGQRTGGQVNWAAVGLTLSLIGTGFFASGLVVSLLVVLGKLS